MDLQLGGAKVVISGGSQGIGLKSQKLFWRNATVKIAARTESKINEALEQLSPFGSATGQVCDVADHDTTVSWMQDTSGNNGRY